VLLAEKEAGYSLFDPNQWADVLSFPLVSWTDGYMALRYFHIEGNANSRSNANACPFFAKCEFPSVGPKLPGGD
jgi:hypothetical protein